MSVAKIGLWVATACFVAAATAQAADVTSPPLIMEAPVEEPQIEWGTGWYLRGDVGWAQERASIRTTDPHAVVHTRLRKNTGSFDLGVGYKWNDYLRTDAVWNWRGQTSPREAGSGNAVVQCPYQARGLSQKIGGADVNVGIAYDKNETCSRQESLKQTRWGMMFNGYIDLPVLARVTPYIGGGVGFASIHHRQEVTYVKTTDNTPYAADLTGVENYPMIWTDPITGRRATDASGNYPNIAFAKQNWNSRESRTKYKFAWALMAGVAFDITTQIKLDVGYRYTSLGNVRFEQTPNARYQAHNSKSHEVRAGLRYMID